MNFTAPHCGALFIGERVMIETEYMSEEEHEEWEGKFDWHGFYEERDKHLTDREREKENRARDRYLKKLGKKYNFDPKDVPRY